MSEYASEPSENLSELQEIRENATDNVWKSQDTP